MMPAPSPSLDEVMAGFEASVVSGVAAERAHTLRTWQAIREPAIATSTGSDVDALRAIARLDAALALDVLRAGSGSTAELDAAVACSDLLHATGLPAEAFLHEQQCLRQGVAASADGPRIGDRTLQLAAAVAATGDVASAGVAWWNATATLLQTRPRVPETQAHAAAEAGLAAFAQADLAHLTAYQRAAWAMLLRHQALAGAPADRLPVLEDALGALLPGTRCGERALLQHDLAHALAQAGRLEHALLLLESATAQASAAGDLGLAAESWGALGQARAAVGDVEAAVEAFDMAADLFDQMREPVWAARARCDYVQALRLAGHAEQALQCAEQALTGLETSIHDTGLAPSQPHADLAVHTAGALAHAAALAAAEIGDPRRAAALATRSASWHRANDDPVGEAGALLLVGESEPDGVDALAALSRACALFNAAGEWRGAAAGQRAAAMAALRADGLGAARAVLAQASAALDAVQPEDPAQARELRWERLCLVDQGARVLATADRFGEALQILTGLDHDYREMGEDLAARDVVDLRARLLDALGRPDEAVGPLREAAEDALAGGHRTQARYLGERLVTLLEELGRVGEARAAQERFGV